MKLWLKYILAGMVGIAAGLFLQTGDLIYGYLFGLAEFGLRLGRYIIFPLFFFTLTISVCQLRRDGLLLKSTLKILMFTLAAVTLQILISTGLSLILPLERIPIITETAGWQSPFPFRGIQDPAGLPEVLRELLPVNIFHIFNNPADIILPALLFSFLLGTQLFKDREEAEPVYNLFDSFDRMLYRMNTLFTEAFTILLIPVTAILVIHLKGIKDFSSYLGLLRIVSISTALFLFVLYPLAYFLLLRRRPFSEIRAFLSALIASVLTGDNIINSQILLRTLKENNGIKRKISGYALPFLTLFARSGTAVITNICLLTILKSYSSLELTPFQVFWVMGVSIFISLLLFSHSYTAVYTALILSCGFYGRGLVEGYVLILPILPVLILFAGLLDTANVAFISLFMAKDEEYCFPREADEFI